ncbi:MAG: hypothetical protein AB8H86_11170 [Polyangiales bacterium]
MEPISSSRSAGISAESSTTERLDQIRMGAGSSPEEMLALASLDVEEAADRSRQTRRLDRQASGVLQRGAIEERRDAAKWQLGSQVFSAAASVATSAAEMPKSKGMQTLNKSLGALGDAVGAGLGYRATQLNQDAATLDLHADEAQQRAGDSGEHADALDQHQGKLMQATESIARLRHDAMMASIRG